MVNGKITKKQAAYKNSSQGLDINDTGLSSEEVSKVSFAYIGKVW